MKFPAVRRITIEDFSKDDQDLVGKLANILNPLFDNLTSIFKGNITLRDNTTTQEKDLIVTVDATGKPTTATSYKTTLTVQTRGVFVMRATASTNNIYPTGAPFICFSESNGQVNILNVTGLQANQTYTLRIIAVG